jgi:hypothetical protein
MNDPLPPKNGDARTTDLVDRDLGPEDRKRVTGEKFVPNDYRLCQSSTVTR